MRILVTSHYGLPHLGGIETAVDGLAAGLAARGHDVVQLTSAVPRGGVPAPRPYRMVRIPAWNGLERRLHVPWPVFSPRLFGSLRRWTAWADVVHAHGFLYMSTALALALARGRPRVLTEHVGHVAYSDAVLDRAEALAVQTVGRACVRAADALVVLNDRVADELVDLAPGTAVETIPNGLDVERYRPPAPGEREALRAELGWDLRPRALFVGRLVPRKGLDATLRAFATLDDAAELVVVGPGRLPAGLPSSVRVLGPRPPEEVARLYRAADLFVLPSQGEGFPVTAQEAISSGLPTVLTDDPAYAAQLAGAGVELIAPEPEALAAALRRLLADPTERARRSASARAHALRSFSWAASAERHEALYERLRA